MMAKQSEINMGGKEVTSPQSREASPSIHVRMLMNQLYSNGTIDTLKSRRTLAISKFAIKAAESPRFGPYWFTQSGENPVSVRPTTRKKYVEPVCRTERGRQNPLLVLTRALNEHYITQTVWHLPHY